ncbi:MAG: helix-turn-helix domain-containing protein [Cyclobacteriaceae bacterium]
MNFIRQVERFQLLNKLISEENTGTPKELAKRLGVSERQLYNLIDILRGEGVKITYSKKIKSYSYSEISSVQISFLFKPIGYDDERGISGGFQIKTLYCNFISERENTFNYDLMGAQLLGQVKSATFNAEI